MSPIRPEDKDRYPENWKEIVAEIRARSGGQCECTGQCGLHCTTGGPRRCIERNGEPASFARGTVVLTVAHLDHTPENVERSNLLDMCQRCHLRYDRKKHAETRRRTGDAKTGQRNYLTDEADHLRGAERHVAHLRALSLTQYWASLVVWGEKGWETRSWKCPSFLIGHTIMIHAAKTFSRDARNNFIEPHFSEVMVRRRVLAPDDLPFGALIGTARIKSCWETEAIREELTSKETAFGNYADKRFAFELVEPRPFAEPIPAKGKLGFWKVPSDLITQCRYVEAVQP